MMEKAKAYRQYELVGEDPELQRLNILLQVVGSMNSEGERTRAIAYVAERFGVLLITSEAIRSAMPPELRR